MKNVINLFESGKVVIGDKPYTRLLGGFGEDKPCLNDKQIADLLGYSKGARQVRIQINNNMKHFTESDLMDLKGVHEKDTYEKVLLSQGYTKSAMTQAENIYLLSQSGFLLYLKFAEGDKSVEIYKNFIEDYFKTKAENIVMKKTLKEEKEFLIEQKKFMLGSMIMEQDDNKKIEFFNQNEKLSNRIKEIEMSLNEELILEKLQPKLQIAESFTEDDNNWDLGVFSKICSIKGYGRNNMFAWFREKKILDSKNIPYQLYVKYFKIIPVKNSYNGETYYKTMIKSNGIEYIFKKLIADNIIITKPLDDIRAELKGMSA